MSGSAVCNTSTGEYTVTYEGDVTSWPDDYTVKAAVVAPAGSTVSPADQSLAHAKTFTVTQIVPGTATSAKVNFAVTWTTAKESWSGNQTVTLGGDCKAPKVESATATVIRTDATCNAPATMTLGEAKNATWPPAVPLTTFGPGHYKVTATATAPAKFDGGATTMVFEGDLAGVKDDASCITKDAIAVATTTDASCGVAGTLVLGAPTNAVWGTPVYDGLKYTVTATATKGHAFADGQTTQTSTGTLQAALPSTDAKCVVTDAGATLTTTAAACGVAGSLTLGTTSNAKWGTPVYDGLKYTVTATATTGHVFADGHATQTFTGTLPAALSSTDATCVVKDASASAAATTASCDVAGTLKLGATSNATWGTPVYTGSDYSVVATADPGHVFTDGLTTKTFTGTLPAVLDSTDPDCAQLHTSPLVTPVVTSKNLTCDASGSYTLASAEGTDEGIIWTVDGKVVTAGTYPVKSAGTVTVTAAPKGPDFGFDFDTQTSWVLDFTDAKDCGGLTTLAMTGTNANTINLGLLFAGGLLLLGGALVIAEKRFRFGKK